MNPFRRIIRIFFASACVLGMLFRADAHADLEERIAAITLKLSQTPTNSAELYLERGDLHRLHEEFAEAQSDISKAEELKPGWLAVRLERARIFFDEANYPAALEVASAVTREQPDHVEASVIRARSLTRLGRATEAIPLYSQVLLKLRSPSPDLFLERASAQAAVGRLDEAVRGLDEGLAKLGPIPSLQIPAIEYERQAGHFDAAVSRVEAIAVKYPQDQSWVVLQAEILEQAGRFALAKETFQRVLAGIEGYPPSRRGLDLTRKLELRAQEGLTRLEPKLFPSTNSPTATSIQL